MVQFAIKGISILCMVFLLLPLERLELTDFSAVHDDGTHRVSSVDRIWEGWQARHGRGYLPPPTADLGERGEDAAALVLDALVGILREAEER